MTPHSTRCLVAELPGTPTEWATLAGGLGARSAASNRADVFGRKNLYKTLRGSFLSMVATFSRMPAIA